MKTEEKKQVRISTIVYSFGLIFVFVLVFLAVMIYVFNFRGEITRKATEIIPYPAALADGKIITLKELDQKLDSVKMFYEKQDFSEIGARIDFETAEGGKRLKIKEKYLLEKLIENRIIENEAKKRGIELSQDVISQEVRRKIGELGDEKSVRDDLKNLYGWSLIDFEKNVAAPDMYKEKLLTYLRENDPSYLEAKEKITKAKKELEEKKSFEDVVNRYSEGESAKNKGDLGWFSSEEMLSEISKEAFLLEEGKTGDIIESPLGYHILRLEGRKKEDEKEKVKISQIFVRTKGIGDWLSEYEKTAKIRIFLRDFYWNSSEREVQFTDPQMEVFRKKTEEDSGGDISVMF